MVFTTAAFDDDHHISVIAFENVEQGKEAFWQIQYSIIWPNACVIVPADSLFQQISQIAESVEFKLESWY